MAAPLLGVEDLSISYATRGGEVPAVARVSFALAAGESLGLVGESGCGKSTIAFALMRHFGGGGRITGGRVMFDGADMAGLSAAALRRVRGGRIAMVFQEAMAALNPCMTIGAQLGEVLRVHAGLSGAAVRARAAAMLDDVRLPDHDRVLRAFPHQLSGGQQQRVVVAMALLAEPALLLLDEPTTGLDVTVEAEVVALIAELSRRRGTGLLYISHNLALIAQVCGRIAVMYAGEIVEEGLTAEVLGRPLHPYTQGLLRCLPMAGADKHTQPLLAIPGSIPAPSDRPGGCWFAPRCRHEVPGRCDQRHPELARIGPSRAVRCLRHAEIADDPPAPATPAAGDAGRTGDAVEVIDLTKEFAVPRAGLAGLFGRTARLRANRQLTFTAPAARTLAIVGESGSGKTTFARILTGLERATSGSITVGGDDFAQLPVTRRTPAQCAKMQMVFQNPDETLNPSYRIGWQIMRVARRLLAGRRAEAAARTEALLREVRLAADISGRRPRQLSGGQKQRVAIARAFIGEPSIVVADEPVAALDVSVRAAVIDVLMQAQQSRGTTLLLISHDLALVRYVADQVVVLYRGRLMEAGPAARVFAPPFHPYTAALLAAEPRLDKVAPAAPATPARQPDALDPEQGCPFLARCPMRLDDRCAREFPPEQLGPDGHRIACHRPLAELMQQEIP
ncbi:MAG: ABC transporter ATP-binding protein [Acetobacteraceae bacterium]|nr:ABC transporter ATP-binding protein [Acetobacteraceae bacterium]